MEGNVRFGPDIDWLSVSEGAVRDEDAWEAHLSPDEERARSMHTAVSRYLPGVKPEGFQIDYVGIRPKLAPPGAPFQDFVVRTDYTNKIASLALAEMVVEDMLVGTGNSPFS
ncbi:hypothetical protein EI94DRAFT_1805612 [Lactarius quietus]|nr:hypothetical protein EI94DRAFT_1805612 [Lactarius quietus]